jgi:hypothetical protein
VDDADAELAGSLLVDIVERLTVELHHALVLGIDAGDDLAQRRLAGAVLAQQGADLAGLDVHRDVVQRTHAREQLGNPGDLETRRHPWTSRRERR